MTLTLTKWREVAPTGSGNTIDLKKSAQGTSVEGTYLGSRTITTALGDNQVYTFEGDGGSFSVYGFTDLNQKLATVEPGTEVRLTYDGMMEVNTKRGRVSMHKVRVEIPQD